MTANQLYEAALALMIESTATAGDYNDFALPVINSLLAETFSANNALRIKAGKEELAEIPMLNSMRDEVPYEPILLRTALPYGVCAKLVIDDDDMGKVAYYQNQYVGFVNDFVCTVPGVVVDVYGSDGE